MIEQFELEKWIWSEDDLQILGWHDVKIYGVQFKEDLILDIDYIFKWNEPEIEGFPFTFWISPATLIFKKPIGLSFELTQSFDDNWLEIEDIEMKTNEQMKHWSILTRQGSISFEANSFSQIIRRKPSLQFGQYIPYTERGGFSFDSTSGDKIKEEQTSEIDEKRKMKFRHYESAKKRFELKKELQVLSNNEEHSPLELKNILIKKNEIKSRINSYNKELKDTMFEGW